MKLRERSTEDQKPDLTPMIDIIFQLLIFFVLTAKFIAFEGQLQAYLPKDRGVSSGPPPVLSDQVAFYLAWDKAGKVLCTTLNYQMNGDTRQQFTFPFDPNAKQLTDGSWHTETRMENATEGGIVRYDYASPDFREVEQYLQYRHQRFESAGASDKGLPVEINFENQVPWQSVVNILDICKRLGISDVSLTAEEHDYDT